MKYTGKLAKKELVRGFPKLRYQKNKIYDYCQMNKKTKVAHKDKIFNSTDHALNLIHMDLFDSSKTIFFE